MQRSRSTSPLFLLVAIVVAVAALYFAKEILLPFALAVLLSFLLTPLANRLERWGLRRVPSVLLVVAMTFVLLGCIGWIVTSQLVELSRELPQYKDNIVDKVRTVVASSGSFSKVSQVIEEVGKEISKGSNEEAGESGDAAKQTPTPKAAAELPRVAQHWLPLLQKAEVNSTGKDAVQVAVVAMPPSPLSQIQTWLGPIVAPLSAAGMVIVLVLFMLIDREDQRNRLLQLFGSANLHATTEAFGEASRRVSQYLRMLFLINATYGICVALGLWAIGVPSAMMWGVLGFSLRFLPYIGPWIAATLPILVSLAVSDGWTQPLLVVGLYVLLELVLNNVVEPWLYGDSVGVSTVGVIVAAIFWTWLWGPVGLVLAMPLTVCLLVLAQYVPQLRFITVLLADRPPMSLVERVYQRMLASDENELLKILTKELKARPLVNVYDDVVIPALSLAESDRHADLLTDDQASVVEEMAEDLVPALAEQSRRDAAESDTDGKGGAVLPSVKAGEARVVCIPLRDEADETCGRMLEKLLANEGIAMEVLSHELLASEALERVESAQAVVVVISILPPIGQRETRLLWKRLRIRFPNLPIIVGCWQSDEVRQLFGRIERDGPSKLVTTLTEATAVIKAADAKARLSAAS
ncbi:MAG: AI-2E family transporter [Pirellulales bacterium]